MVCTACFYPAEPDPFEGLAAGDVRAVAVGRLAGIQTQQPVPLSGVHVRLRGSLQRTTTAADGAFVLRNLPVGTHQVTLTVGPLDQPLTVARHTFSVTQRNGTRAAINLGELELLPPASLAATVALAGPGVLQDVRVGVLQGAGENARPDPRGLVTPDGAGRVSLEGLGPGDWTVLAAVGAHAVASGPHTLTPGQQRDVGTITVDTNTPTQPATAQLTVFAPPNVDAAGNITARLVPLGNAAGLVACGTSAPLQAQGLDLVMVGCVEGGAYRLEVAADEEAGLLPYVFDGVILRPGLNLLGDVFLTLPQDCPECVPPQPDGGFGMSSSSGGVSSSSGASSSSSSGGAGFGAVEPTVPTRTAFNSWVDPNGLFTPPTQDLSCPTVDMVNLSNCVHAGVHRRMEVPGQTECNTLTFGDSAGIFVWQCFPGTPVQIISMGFERGKGLKDLLEWDGAAAAQWRTDLVLEVRDTTNTLVLQSTPGVAWWSDRIVVDPPTPVDTVSQGMDPLVVVLTPQAGPDLNVGRGLVAVTTPLMAATDPAVEINLAPLASQSWLEGEYATAVAGITINTSAVRLHELHIVGHLALNNTRGVLGTEVTLSSPTQATAHVTVNNGNSVELRDVTVTSNGIPTGVAVVSGQGVKLERVWVFNPGTGIDVRAVAANTAGSVLLDTVRVEGATGNGVEVTGSSDVRMTQVRVARCGPLGAGVYVTTSPRAVLLGGQFTNCLNGLKVESSAGGVFRRVLAAHNTSYGVDVVGSSRILVAEVTAAHNGASNVRLVDVTEGRLSSVLSYGAGTTGVLLAQAVTGSQTTQVHDLVSANNGAQGLAVQNITGGLEFHGVLRLGGPTTACVNGNPFAGLDGACLPTSPSTATLEPAVDLSGELVLNRRRPTTAMEADLENQWTAQTDPLWVWGPSQGRIGRCTGECVLLDYALANTAVWTMGLGAAPILAQHTWPANVTEAAGCVALAGTYSATDAACVSTYALARTPLPSASAAVTPGLCVPRVGCTTEPSCSCIRVQNAGAYQGEGALAPAVGENINGSVLMVQSFQTNGH